MAHKKNQDLYTKLFWIFTALMLLTAIPLGVVLILVKLFEMRKKRRTAVFRPVSDAPLGAQTTIRPDLRPAQVVLQEATKKTGRRVVLGLILEMVSAALLVFCAMNDINTWTPTCCVFVSGYYMCLGIQTRFSLHRFQNYQSAMGKQPVMAIPVLAAKSGLTEKQIRTDLTLREFMEMLPNAVFDRDRDLLFWFQTM